MAAALVTLADAESLAVCCGCCGCCGGAALELELCTSEFTEKSVGVEFEVTAGEG